MSERIKENHQSSLRLFRRGNSNSRVHKRRHTNIYLFIVFCVWHPKNCFESVKELFYFLYASDSFPVDNNYLKDEMAANVIEYRKLSSAGLWLSDWFEILAFLTNQMSNWGYSTPRLLAFSRASGGLLCSLWDIFLIGCRNSLVLVLRHLIEKHSRSDRYVASGNQALSEILLVISADFSHDSCE